MVSCTCAVEACSAWPIAGSDGRYMSIDSGPRPVSSDSNKVSAKVPGRSIGINQYPGLHKAQSGVKRAPRPSASPVVSDQVLAPKNWHQPFGLIVPSTILQALGAWNWTHPSHS